MRPYETYEAMVAGEIEVHNEQEEKLALEASLRQARQDFRSIVGSIGSIEKELGIETDGEDGVEPILDAVAELRGRNRELSAGLSDTEKDVLLLRGALQAVMRHMNGVTELDPQWNDCMLACSALMSTEGYGES